MYSRNSGETLAALSLLVFFAIVMPFISFWISYFGGWITSLLIGNTLCEALNTLFNVTYFSPNKLPMIAGALGFIGGYFKTTVRTKQD